MLGILLLLILLLYPNTAWAQPACQITTNPSTVTTNDRSVSIEIKTTGILPTDQDKNYWVKLDSFFVRDLTRGGPAYDLKVVNNTISVPSIGIDGIINRPSNPFQAKTYRITVQDNKVSGATTFCAASFAVQGATSGGICEIEFKNPSFTVNDEIIMKVLNLSGNSEDGRRVVLKRDKENGNEVRAWLTNVDKLRSRFSLDRHEAGVYYVEVRKAEILGGFLGERLCFTKFIIGDVTKSGEIPPGPCKEVTDPKTGKKTFVCDTALGDISSDPGKFISRIFGILLSLAGGIALLLIIISGYRLMASQGNPEKVQAAREQLTSAIVGLLFIIFSLAILTIIGVDILRIPGFER